MDDELFPEIVTLTDIVGYVSRQLADARESVAHGGAGHVPVATAEPGPLMAKAVEMAGPDGLSRETLLELFEPVGVARTLRGIDQMKASGRVITCLETGRDEAPRHQQQIVYRAVKLSDEER